MINLGCAIAIIPFVEIQKFIEWTLRRKKNKRIVNYQSEQDLETEEQN